MEAHSSRSKRWRRLDYQGKVNVIAALVALFVFCAAGIALLSQPIPDKPTGKVPGETVRTTTRTNETDSETEKRLRSEMVEEKEPAKDTDQSVLGRAFDNSAGVVILRLFLALLAAFAFGFVIQRVLLGFYGIAQRSRA